MWLSDESYGLMDVFSTARPLAAPTFAAHRIGAFAPKTTSRLREATSHHATNPPPDITNRDTRQRPAAMRGLFVTA